MLGQDSEYNSSCGATRLGTSYPLSVYNHTQAFVHGEPPPSPLLGVTTIRNENASSFPITATLFGSPSEVHSFGSGLRLAPPGVSLLTFPEVLLFVTGLQRV